MLIWRNLNCSRDDPKLAEEHHCGVRRESGIRMMDRLLSIGLNLTIVSLTAAVAAGSVLLAYAGLLQTLQGQVRAGPVAIAVGIALAVGAWQLARNRNDLADC
jgi:hypothetical protein